MVPPRDRARFERLCRYARRPPVAHDRLHVTSEGQVVLDLRRRWADGTTRLVFDPLELLERLAALTPRPRINLLLYYGVLGARSAWRGRIAGAGVGPSAGTTGASTVSHAHAVVRPDANRLWAELMQRSFPPSPGPMVFAGLRRDLAEALRAEAGGFDVLACPRCGGRSELIALIEDAAVIRRILSHLGLPAEVPAARPARPPPLLIGDPTF